MFVYNYSLACLSVHLENNPITYLYISSAGKLIGDNPSTSSTQYNPYNPVRLLAVPISNYSCCGNVEKIPS